MELHLQEQEDIQSLLPCVYQENKESYFKPSALGLMKESIVVYYDNMPDHSSQLDGYNYSVHRRVLLKDIVCVLNEKVKYVKSFAYCYRLNILAKNTNDCFVVYFKKEDLKYANHFLKLLSKARVPIQDHVTRIV